MNSSDESTNNTWTLVDITVTTEESEIVADALWTLGVVAIEERHLSESTVVLRTSMGQNPHRAIDQINTAFPHILTSIVNIDRTVADTWREFAHASYICDNIYLVPDWLNAPVNSRAIFVEPFDTFGLGNHPTTILTLRLALQVVAEKSDVFDFGSGSGVLSVAMSVLLNCSVTAHDIADSAEHALQANARRNNANSCLWSDEYPSGSFDAVLANILAPVLIKNASRITESTREGGVLILSGIRTEQVDRVVSHFSSFTEQRREEMDGWVGIALTKV